MERLEGRRIWFSRTACKILPLFSMKILFTLLIICQAFAVAQGSGGSGGNRNRGEEVPDHCPSWLMSMDE